MAKKLPSKKINHSKYLDFKKVAENFRDAAELAFEFGYYNAAGVLIIHAAIAYADSITIKVAFQKMSGDSHYDVITLLKSVIPPQYKKNTAFNHFKKLIDHKNFVSYTGDIYRKDDMEKLGKHFYRFEKWAKSILEE